MNHSTTQQVIVIGASSGGVNAILALALTLPRSFPAPILFVQHIGARQSELSKLVSARGPNPAAAAADGDIPRLGTIHIAPPDHHMLLDQGVILKGMLDDGSAGLRAIKDCGGTAVVQDPADAYAYSMPTSALASVSADHVVPLLSMGSLLHKLACRRPAPLLRGCFVHLMPLSRNTRSASRETLSKSFRPSAALRPSAAQIAAACCSSLTKRN